MTKSPHQSDYVVVRLWYDCGAVVVISVLTNTAHPIVGIRLCIKTVIHCLYQKHFFKYMYIYFQLGHWAV